MIVHAIVNSVTVFADPSLIKIIYPLISTLVCGFITFRLAVSNKTWDGMINNTTKPVENQVPAATAEKPAAAEPTEGAAATAEKPAAAEPTEGAAFGKRQRRRNPSKRRRKKY